jgi:hypothetical protein
MQYLSGKNILLISPQPWDHVFISKHHYAEELARNGNSVYFLEPPSEMGKPGIRVRPHEIIENLFLISWRPFFPRIFRFHLYPIYKVLAALQARLITRKIGGSLDVIWSFDFNLFPNLKAFGPTFNIFHPVDPLTSNKQISIGESCDLIISVSHRIMSNFSGASFVDRKMLVGHGLNREFAELAAGQPEISESNNNKKRVGYFGNLDRGIINLPVWYQIIISNLDVDFHFWGPYSEENPFVRMITQQPNVVVHGQKTKKELVKEVGSMDCFLLIYSDNKSESDRSNSHKILEYLSTGKVIVSNCIEAYQDQPELVRTPGEGNDELIPELFRETIENLDMYNSNRLMMERKHYAQAHTYENNLHQIDKRISHILEARV